MENQDPSKITQNNKLNSDAYSRVVNTTDKDNHPDTPGNTADTTASKADYCNKAVVCNNHNDHLKPD